MNFAKNEHFHTIWGILPSLLEETILLLNKRYFIIPWLCKNGDHVISLWRLSTFKVTWGRGSGSQGNPPPDNHRDPDHSANTTNNVSSSDTNEGFVRYSPITKPPWHHTNSPSSQICFCYPQCRHGCLCTQCPSPWPELSFLWLGQNHS